MCSELNVSPDSILKLFECPVCTEFMHPPIRVCTSTVGHSLCDKCFSKVKTCPICRQDLSQTARSLVLEEVHDKLNFPCRNRETGCHKISTGSSIKGHETFCRYRKLACPLRMAEKLSCRWNGYLDDTIEHYKIQHANSIFRNSTQTITWRNFVSYTKKKCLSLVALFNVFDKYFLFQSNINFVHKRITWYIDGMGSECENTFDFKIEVKKTDNTEDNLNLRGRCLRFNNISKENIPYIIMIEYETLKKYCIDGDFNYDVTIIKNDS